MKQTTPTSVIALSLLLWLGCLSSALAQPMASDALMAPAKGNYVPFDIASAGISQPVRWGIDTAWLWDWWPLRATNHM